jgi:hypothetical protein
MSDFYQDLDYDDQLLLGLISMSQTNPWLKEEPFSISQYAKYSGKEIRTITFFLFLILGWATGSTYLVYKLAKRLRRIF